MLYINIKVFPSSGRKTLLINKKGEICCYVKGAPEKGKANNDVITLIAKKCKVSARFVSIKRGLTSRKKYIAIDVDMTKEQFLNFLGAGIQKAIF